MTQKPPPVIADTEELRREIREFTGDGYGIQTTLEAIVMRRIFPLMDEVERLRAVVDALPKCESWHVCGRVATQVERLGIERYCDEHATNSPVDLPYAAALRELQKSTLPNQ